MKKTAVFAAAALFCSPLPLCRPLRQVRPLAPLNPAFLRDRALPGGGEAGPEKCFSRGKGVPPENGRLL